MKSFKCSCKEWLLLRVRLFTLRLLSLVYSDYSSPRLKTCDIPEPGIYTKIEDRHLEQAHCLNSHYLKEKKKLM